MNVFLVLIAVSLNFIILLKTANEDAFFNGWSVRVHFFWTSTSQLQHPSKEMGGFVQAPPTCKYSTGSYHKCQ